jgi:twitching motility protein PilU
MLDKKGSDLFISADFPPSMKINGKMTPVTQQKNLLVNTPKPLQKD